MIDVTYVNKVCNFTLHENAERCDFLQFLKHTSMIEPYGSEYEYRNDVHLLSKLCAIGYLLVGYKDEKCPRAIICESGIKNGKSLFVNLFKEITQMYVIPGRVIDGQSPFIWSQMPENTKIVFIDDLPEKFNLELIYPNITGNWVIRKKGGRNNVIPFKKSPKIILETIKPLSGKGASFEDRIWRLQFSNYYHKNHNVVSEFGKIFYFEWNTSDWAYTWELIADCIKLYLRYGCIDANVVYRD